MYLAYKSSNLALLFNGLETILESKISIFVEVFEIIISDFHTLYWIN